jgi:hypothetical protein
MTAKRVYRFRYHNTIGLMIADPQARVLHQLQRGINIQIRTDTGEFDMFHISVEYNPKPFRRNSHRHAPVNATFFVRIIHLV